MADDVVWLNYAIQLAERARQQGEVPVGAVLVSDQAIIGEGWNKPIISHDPTAHAEIMALRNGAQTLQNYRLTGSTLYVTLEPCAMCAGAMIHARIKRLVFGAYDPRAGAISSVFKIIDSPLLNHRIDWQGGLLAETCGQQLQDFFKQRRKRGL
jgi:tRNA(adenine34) deaminase